MHVNVNGLFSIFVLLLVSYIVLVDAGDSYSSGGCLCLSTCERSLASLTLPACETSPKNPPANATSYCGYYSSVLSVYIDTCIPNVTSSNPQVFFLDSFNQIWTYTTVSVTAGCAAVYAVAGCIASCLTSPKRTFLWLPGTALLFGACQGFVVGSIFAIVMSFMYLSMPYAIESRVAIALGLGLALLLVYSALGRQYQRFSAPHASEFGD
jgi:Putative transmembrane protein 170